MNWNGFQLVYHARIETFEIPHAKSTWEGWKAEEVFNFCATKCGNAAKT